MNSLNRNMTKQQVVIQKRLPHGYLVKDVDDQYGLLRAREVSWDDSESWKAKFRLGQSIGVVQTVFLGEAYEYSYRLAEKDPWHDLHTKYAIGQLVVGTVENVSETTVWAEIEPGVTGVLSRKDLPTWLNDSYDMQACFWPGDMLKAAVTQLDYQKRVVKLSLATAREKYDEKRSFVSKNEDYLASRARKKETTYQLMAQTSSKSIWIVEDDAAQRESIGRWLQRNGHHVTTFESAEACLEMLEENECDVILTDIGLPNMNGFELAKHLAFEHPSIFCAMMTDLFRINQSPDMQGFIEQGYAILCKPVLPEDIANLFSGMQSRNTPRRSKRKTKGSKLTEANNQFQLQSDKQAKKKILMQLLQHTAAEQAILFSIDPITRQVEIVERVGSLKIHSASFFRLIHSPVRDAAEDNQFIHIQNSQEQAEYSRYLKNLIPFGSCIGVPVLTSLSLKYALFVFHKEPRFFSHFHPEYVKATAFRLGGILEQDNLLRQVSGMQQLAMLGNLSRAMVHELNHKLGPIAFAIEDLEEICHVVSNATDIGLAATKRAIGEASTYINELSTSIDGLMHTAKLFGELTAQTNEELIKVEEVVDDVVWIMKDLARDYKVQVDWQKPEKMHLTRANSAQLQQVLLNTMVNSLQQIDAMRNIPSELIGLIQVGVNYKMRKPKALD